MKYLYLTILLLINSLLVLAQEELKPQLTEVTVNLEEAFLNAQKELIVGKQEKAIELFENLYKENRSDAGIAYELAKIYYAKKDLVLAEKYGKIAYDNTKDNIWVMEFYADFLLQNHRPQDAYQIFQKLITLNPTGLKYYQNSVDALLLQNKPADALVVYDLMEKNNGPSTEVYLSRMELYEKIGNNTSAIQQIDKLIVANPNDITFLKTKARFYTRQNQVDKAIEIYKKILELDPQDTDSNLAILSKGEAKDKPNAYLNALIPIISNPSIHIDAKVKELIPYVKNLADGNLKNETQALKDIGDKLVLAHPDEAKAYSIYGDILYYAGDIDQAIVKYEKTIALNNKVFAVWEQLMYAYYDVMDYQNLYKLSSKAIDMFPNQAINYYFNALANIYFKKNLEEAKSIAEEGKIVSGGNILILNQINSSLAAVYISKKDFDNAKNILDETMKNGGDKNDAVIETLGDWFLAKGDNQKALEQYTLSFKLGNNSKRLSQKIANFKTN